MVGKKFEIFKPVIWRGIRIRLSINKKKVLTKTVRKCGPKSGQKIKCALFHHFPLQNFNRLNQEVDGKGNKNIPWSLSPLSDTTRLVSSSRTAGSWQNGRAEPETQRGIERKRNSLAKSLLNSCT